jgi:hypothetical protein
MEDLPLKYKPSSLEEKKYFLTEKREVAYGIGIEYNPNEFGMTDGPFFEIYALLEIVPGDDKSCIIRFNGDGTDDILYRWKNDSWIKQPTLKRK